MRRVFLALLGYLCVGPGFSADCPFSFAQPARRFPTGLDQPLVLASGDFNGDGEPDLVVGGSRELSVLLSRRDGGFEPPRLVEFPGPVSAVATADFNRDGKLDLAVVIGLPPDKAALEVLLGRGDASFDAPQEYALPGSSPGLLVAADLDGDSRLDLVAGTDLRIGGRVPTFTTLFGSSDGSFSDPTRVVLPSFSPSGMVAADFDLDGKAEVVVGGDISAVRIRSSSSRVLAVDPLTDVFGAVAVGDFNNDGYLDLVSRSNSDVTTFLNDSHGSFSFGSQSNPPGDIVGLAVFDLDRDRAPDVVVSDFEQSLLEVLRGNGDGTLQPAEHYFGGGTTVAIVRRRKARCRDIPGSGQHGRAHEQ
jgi:hypothetical protein